MTPDTGVRDRPATMRAAPQHFRERAVDALEAWGEDTAGLAVGRDPWAFIDADLPRCALDHGTGSWTNSGDAPPF
ncbi:hypothetical protein [Streptacidiphilus jiangxiensis]|uniref:Uncharacterized protein n=1 Tax=Streptacidiphilus jiangxiensis TaxID=235985 RepID=A0A1H7TK73_STRJI|nr:hypothetical protein [Streptacidiphilus jiangxiensis]SEL85201.1 hypothetical protein SAMN05414137_11437 [Streptacidiphilus jiangxiensis]